MKEEYSMADTSRLMEAASDFAHYPGVQNDAAAKEFLDRFPLPAIISTLQTRADVPGLETTLVNCLERLFKTKYGASLIPHFMPFVQVGLQAASQEVRCLACKTVSCLLENSDEKSVSAVKLIIDYNVYPLLLDCLVNGNEQVAAASMDAIKVLACFQGGTNIVFPASENEVSHLRNLAAQCTSLGRVRVLALIVKLFSVSSSVASIIYSSNLLSLLEAEISNSQDTLVSLSVLELLYEMVEIRHATEILSRTALLQLLSSIISNASLESILRSRAMMVCGRLLSKEDTYLFTDEPSVRVVVSAIDASLSSSESLDTDECESALEALGQIGLSTQGAELLLSSTSPAARHVVHGAFDRQGRGKQLAALHALGNLAGEARSENSVILNGAAEETLRFLIYEAASRSPKLTPSGFFVSVLQQEAETRLAGYRLITAFVARPWCLMEICSKEEIIDIVTDPCIETTKGGMEARYRCCQATHNAFTRSSKLLSDPSLAGIASKLQDAVRRGPYLARRHSEAQPAVMTAERF
ncbi:uncharacterized protein LOC115726265 isoform X2 [Rhodamnia argentea]|uniref:Uncharacterized protein LOC115726265 isoform X2 n=1 Tax=Rhodamnia argentea TaxID=178133 RepID=A0A8B8MMV4_9MYRT|nr:uncharacterized protein LOC115726265 isoform X2 [Rhodamnia argentea]